MSPTISLRQTGNAKNCSATNRQRIIKKYIKYAFFRHAVFVF